MRIEQPRRHGHWDSRYDGPPPGPPKLTLVHTDWHLPSGDSEPDEGFPPRLVLVGPGRPDHEPISVWENEGGGNVQAAKLPSTQTAALQPGLGWDGFRTAGFPGHLPHDLAALKAYESYRHTPVAEARPA